MQTALEISFYVLAGIVALGLLMVLVLVKDLFFHGHFTVHPPALKRVPTTALDESRRVLGELKAAHGKAQGERKNAVSYEIKHLEHRIATLEDKTYRDQSDYYDAVRARERIWREWRALHQEGSQGGFRRRKELAPALAEHKAQYLALDREVNEEWHRAVARDSLTLEELRSQGVLEPEALNPQPAPEEAGAQAEATPPLPPARPPSKWPTPLAPYPPAAAGELRQEDLLRPDLPKSERTYVEPVLALGALPNGVLAGVDFSRSSLAEVEFGGVHRYQNCAFVATDLRRIELKLAEAAHVFQDCDFRGASLAQSLLAGTVFRRCNLSSTHWRGARLDRIKFESCRLDGIHWEGVDLSRTVFSEDMLASADFSEAGAPPHNLSPPADPTPATGGTPPGPSRAAPPSPTQGPARRAAPSPGGAANAAPPANPAQPAPSVGPGAESPAHPDPPETPPPPESPPAAAITGDAPGAAEPSPPDPPAPPPEKEA